MTSVTSRHHVYNVYSAQPCTVYTHQEYILQDKDLIEDLIDDGGSDGVISGHGDWSLVSDERTDDIGDEFISEFNDELIDKFKDDLIKGKIHDGSNGIIIKHGDGSLVKYRGE